jgi:uracil-DNA glycosylase
LGAFAWSSYWPMLNPVYGVAPPTPRPAFGHGVRVDLPGSPSLLGCYHVSQQNTFTGRLTPAMLDDVLAAARGIAGL